MSVERSTVEYMSCIQVRSVWHGKAVMDNDSVGFVRILHTSLYMLCRCEQAVMRLRATVAAFGHMYKLYENAVNIFEAATPLLITNFCLC